MTWVSVHENTKKYLVLIENVLFLLKVSFAQKCLKVKYDVKHTKTLFVKMSW